MSAMANPLTDDHQPVRCTARTDTTHRNCRLMLRGFDDIVRTTFSLVVMRFGPFYDISAIGPAASRIEAKLPLRQIVQYQRGMTAQ
jgi:hypothetical protein